MSRAPSASRSHASDDTPAGSSGRRRPVPTPSEVPRARTVTACPLERRWRTVGAPCSPEPPITSTFMAAAAAAIDAWLAASVLAKI